MKLADVMDVINVLQRARVALRIGDLSIKEQMELGTECSNAAIRLEMAIREAGFNLPIEDKS